MKAKSILFAALTLCTSLAAADTALAAAGCKNEAAAAAGLDAAALCDIVSDFGRDIANFHGLVVERHGVIVAEAYKSGKDKSIYSLWRSTNAFDASTRHDLRSISKSVTSLLWGIAQDQHLTPPLNSPVLDHFPDLDHLKTMGRESILIGDLFTMSAGLAWNEPNDYASANDELGLYWHSHQARYVFDRPMAAARGTRFKYNGGGTAVLAQILASRVGMTLPDYARKYLFEPLGITDWEWQSDVRGRPLSFSGLRMRPRDLARIGRMVADRGMWQGRRIVAPEWIDESTRPHIGTGDGLGYGYFWWTGTVDAMGAAYPWSAGFGNGGQRLYVVPGLDLVIVITAGDYDKPAIGPLGGKLFKRIVATVRQ